MGRWLTFLEHFLCAIYRSAKTFLLFVQLPSHVQLFVTPWTAACQASCLSPSPEVCPSSCPLQWWCHPAISSSDSLFSLCPQSFPASETKMRTASAVRIRWPKYLTFSFSISPSNAYSGLISLKIDLFDLLAVQGTLRSTTVQRHQFFGTLPSLMVELSHLYVTTVKTIALTIWTFAGRVMSLLFNTLSRFVIAFLPRSNCLLISWLQSLSAVILLSVPNP